LIALLLWSERAEREAQREAPASARTPAQGPDSRPDTASRERPTRERTQRP
jgi:hypothetical protein